MPLPRRTSVFTDKQSDFLAYLNIWDSFQRERDKGLSNKQLVQWCRQYFLSHLRMREWRELHHQLAQTAIEMGLTTKEAAFRRPPEVRQLTSSENAGDQDLSAKLKQKQLDKKQHRAQIRAAKEAGYEQIHRALLTGLIANIGMKSPDGNDYTGARGSRFHLFPASALFKAKPKWVMAAELVETTKLYARDVAAIQPEWIEQEAPHLVRYHYFEPHWEQKTRRSHRQRTGNALRPDRLATPPRVLRQNRPRRSARNLYPQRVGGAGMRFESGIFCPQQKAD